MYQKFVLTFAKYSTAIIQIIKTYSLKKDTNVTQSVFMTRATPSNTGPSGPDGWVQWHKDVTQNRACALFR